MVYVGREYVYKEHIVHVQDVDLINLLALVGVVDANGIVWDTWWVPFNKLERT